MTGAGSHESDLALGTIMTDAQAEPNVLALNSDSSSLKFGLYRVGLSQLEVLLSETVNDTTGRFHTSRLKS